MTTNQKRWDALSNEMKVLWAVVKLKKEGQIVWKGSLNNYFDGTMAPATVSKAVNQLIDCKVLTLNWNRHQGRWCGLIDIVEGMGRFTEALFEFVEEPSNT